MAPKFSIIIPAYNAEGHINKALDSVANQTYQDYELLVICDSCKDDTYEIAKSYTKNVYTVNFHNDGLTRNFGLDHAHGEWIMFMDDDDWWLHEYVLELLANKIKEMPNDIDVIAFSFIWRGVTYAKQPRGDGKYYYATWSKCWRRSSIGDTRFSSVDKWSDVDFHNGMFRKNLKILNWDMPMYYYNYMRPGSISYNHFVVEGGH